MRGLLRLGGEQSSSIETNVMGCGGRACCGECLQGRAGVQGRADTLQVRPCKLAVAIHGDTTVGTTLHPSSVSNSEWLLEKASRSCSQPLKASRRCVGMPLPRPFDAMVGNCSCISDTSAIPGGRMASTSLQGSIHGVSWQGHTNATACTD